MPDADPILALARHVAATRYDAIPRAARRQFGAPSGYWRGWRTWRASSPLVPGVLLGWNALNVCVLSLFAALGIYLCIDLT